MALRHEAEKLECLGNTAIRTKTTKESKFFYSRNPNQNTLNCDNHKGKKINSKTFD